MGKGKSLLLAGLLALALLVLAGCAARSAKDGAATGETGNPGGGEVNLYTDRHYDTDEKLFQLFTQQTGIKVNVVKGESDEIIERLAREGGDSKADLLLVADAGRLYRAKEKGLLQPVNSPVLEQSIPEKLRDRDKQWYGLTVRARVLVYSKERVQPGQLSTYEDLTGPQWRGKILVRSAGNIYNQSLLASLIAINGEEAAQKWAQGIVANLARPPKGNDRDQVKAIAAGEGDVAIVNTYYIGKMLHSSDPAEVQAARKVGVFFPNQQTSGTHINVSGIGLTAAAKNKENAVKLMEFLAGQQAQEQFAQANFEYPANPAVQPAPLLKSWGDFKAQQINLTVLGENNAKAVRIFDAVGWK